MKKYLVYENMHNSYILNSIKNGEESEKLAALNDLYEQLNLSADGGLSVSQMEEYINVLIHVINKPHMNYNNAYGRNSNSGNVGSGKSGSKKKGKGVGSAKNMGSVKIKDTMDSGLNSFFKIIQERIGVYASDFDEDGNVDEEDEDEEEEEDDDNNNNNDDEEEDEVDEDDDDDDYEEEEEVDECQDDEEDDADHDDQDDEEGEDNEVDEVDNVGEASEGDSEFALSDANAKGRKKKKRKDAAKGGKCKGNNKSNNEGKKKRASGCVNKRTSRRASQRINDRLNKGSNKEAKREKTKSTKKALQGAKPKGEETKKKATNRGVKKEIIINSEDESIDFFSYSSNSSDSSSESCESSVTEENEQNFLNDACAIDVKYINIIYTATCCIYAILDIYPQTIRYVINNKDGINILNRKLNDIEYIDVAEVILKIFEKLVEKDPMLILKKKSIKYMLMHIDFYNVNIQKKIFFCIIQMINNISKHRHITKYITPYCSIFTNFFHFHYIHILNIICTLWRSLLDKMIIVRLEEENKLRTKTRRSVTDNGAGAKEGSSLARRKDSKGDSYLSKLMEKTDKRKKKKREQEGASGAKGKGKMKGLTGTPFVKSGRAKKQTGDNPREGEVIEISDEEQTSDFHKKRGNDTGDDSIYEHLGEVKSNKQVKKKKESSTNKKSKKKPKNCTKEKVDDGEDVEEAGEVPNIIDVGEGSEDDEVEIDGEDRRRKSKRQVQKRSKLKKDDNLISCEYDRRGRDPKDSRNKGQESSRKGAKREQIKDEDVYILDDQLSDSINFKNSKSNDNVSFLSSFLKGSGPVSGSKGKGSKKPMRESSSHGAEEREKDSPQMEGTFPSKDEKKNATFVHHQNKLLQNIIHLNSSESTHIKLCAEIESIYSINIRNNIIKLLIECKIEDNLYAFMETFYIISILVHHSDNILEDFCNSEFLSKFSEIFQNEKYQSNNFLTLYLLFTLYSFLPMCTFNGLVIYDYDMGTNLSGEAFVKQGKNQGADEEDGKNSSIGRKNNVEVDSSDDGFFPPDNTPDGYMPNTFPVDVKKHKLDFYRNHFNHLATLIKVIIPSVYRIYEETVYFDIKYLCVVITLSVFISMYKISLTLSKDAEFVNSLEYIFLYHKETCAFIRNLVLNNLSESSVISGIIMCRIVEHFAVLIGGNSMFESVKDEERGGNTAFVNRNGYALCEGTAHVLHPLSDNHGSHLHVLKNIISKILEKKMDDMYSTCEGKYLCPNKEIYNIMFCYFYELYKKGGDCGEGVRKGRCERINFLFFNWEREMKNISLEFEVIFLNYQNMKLAKEKNKMENGAQPIRLSHLIVDERTCYNGIVLSYCYLVNLFGHLSSMGEDASIYFYQYNVAKRLYFFLFQKLFYQDGPSEMGKKGNNDLKNKYSSLACCDINRRNVLNLLKSIDRNVRLYIFLYALLFNNHNKKGEVVRGLFLNSVRRLYGIFYELGGDQVIDDIDEVQLNRMKGVVTDIFDSYHYYLIMNNLSFTKCSLLIRLTRECLNVHDNLPIYFFKDSRKAPNNSWSYGGAKKEQGGITPLEKSNFFYHEGSSNVDSWTQNYDDFPSLKSENLNSLFIPKYRKNNNDAFVKSIKQRRKKEKDEENVGVSGKCSRIELAEQKKKNAGSSHCKGGILDDGAAAGEMGNEGNGQLNRNIQGEDGEEDQGEVAFDVNCEKMRIIKNIQREFQIGEKDEADDAKDTQNNNKARRSREANRGNPVIPIIDVLKEISKEVEIIRERDPDEAKNQMVGNADNVHSKAGVEREGMMDKANKEKKKKNNKLNESKKGHSNLFDYFTGSNYKHFDYIPKDSFYENLFYDNNDSTEFDKKKNKSIYNNYNCHFPVHLRRNGLYVDNVSIFSSLNEGLPISLSLEKMNQGSPEASAESEANESTALNELTSQGGQKLSECGATKDEVGNHRKDNKMVEDINDEKKQLSASIGGGISKLQRSPRGVVHNRNAYTKDLTHRLLFLGRNYQDRPKNLHATFNIFDSLNKVENYIKKNLSRGNRNANAKYYSKEDDLVILSVNGIDVHNYSCLSEYLIKLNDLYYMRRNSACLNEENIFYNTDNFYVYNDIVELLPIHYGQMKSQIRYLWNGHGNGSSASENYSLGGSLYTGDGYPSQIGNNTHSINFKVIKKRKQNELSCLNFLPDDFCGKGNIHIVSKKKKTNNNAVELNEETRRKLYERRENQDDLYSYVDPITFRKIKSSIETPLNCRIVSEKFNFFNISFDLVKNLYNADDLRDGTWNGNVAENGGLGELSKKCFFRMLKGDPTEDTKKKEQLKHEARDDGSETRGKLSNDQKADVSAGVNNVDLTDGQYYADEYDADQIMPYAEHLSEGEEKPSFLIDYLKEHYRKKELNLFLSQRNCVESDSMYLSTFLKTEMRKVTELVFLDEHYINKDVMLSTHLHNIHFLVHQGESDMEDSRTWRRESLVDRIHRNRERERSLYVKYRKGGIINQDTIIGEQAKESNHQNDIIPSGEEQYLLFNYMPMYSEIVKRDKVSARLRTRSGGSRKEDQCARKMSSRSGQRAKGKSGQARDEDKDIFLQNIYNFMFFKFLYLLCRHFNMCDIPSLLTFYLNNKAGDNSMCKVRDVESSCNEMLNAETIKEMNILMEEEFLERASEVAHGQSEGNTPDREINPVVGIKDIKKKCFILNSINNKVMYYLNNPLFLFSEKIPSWVYKIFYLFNFVVDIDIRLLFFEVVYFGNYRGLYNYKQKIKEVVEKFNDKISFGNKSLTEEHLLSVCANYTYNCDKKKLFNFLSDNTTLTLPRTKIKLHRNKMVDSSFRIFNHMHFINSNFITPSYLDIEFFNEEGTGLGPSLEFYNEVIEELKKEKLKLFKLEDTYLFPLSYKIDLNNFDFNLLKKPKSSELMGLNSANNINGGAHSGGNNYYAYASHLGNLGSKGYHLQNANPTQSSSSSLNRRINVITEGANGSSYHSVNSLINHFLYSMNSNVFTNEGNSFGKYEDLSEMEFLGNKMKSKKGKKNSENIKKGSKKNEIKKKNNACTGGDGTNVGGVSSTSKRNKKKNEQAKGTSERNKKGDDQLFTDSDVTKGQNKQKKKYINKGDEEAEEDNMEDDEDYEEEEGDIPGEKNTYSENYRKDKTDSSVKKSTPATSNACSYKKNTGFDARMESIIKLGEEEYINSEKNKKKRIRCYVGSSEKQEEESKKKSLMSERKVVDTKEGLPPVEGSESVQMKQAREGAPEEGGTAVDHFREEVNQGIEKIDPHGDTPSSTGKIGKDPQRVASQSEEEEKFDSEEVVENTGKSNIEKKKTDKRPSSKKHHASKSNEIKDSQIGITPNKSMNVSGVGSSSRNVDNVSIKEEKAERHCCKLLDKGIESKEDEGKKKKLDKTNKEEDTKIVKSEDSKKKYLLSGDVQQEQIADNEKKETSEMENKSVHVKRYKLFTKDFEEHFMKEDNDMEVSRQQEARRKINLNDEANLSPSVAQNIITSLISEMENKSSSQEINLKTSNEANEKIKEDTAENKSNKDESNKPMANNVGRKFSENFQKKLHEKSRKKITNIEQDTLENRLFKYFKLLGQLCAKILTDNRNVNVNLHPLFWYLVMNNSGYVNISKFQHYQAIDRVNMSSINKLLEYRKENKNVEDLMLDFTLLGSDPPVELIPNGANIAVNNENLDLFINKTIEYSLYEGIKFQVKLNGTLSKHVCVCASLLCEPLYMHISLFLSLQIWAFRFGFSTIAPLLCTNIFDEEEICEYLFGSNIENDEHWTKLHLSTYIKPDHGYTNDSVTFITLIEILSEFNKEERKLFVKFCTGTSALPNKGFAALKPLMKVVKKEDNNDLPSVMTCTNYLKIPDYKNKEKLRNRLLYAINEGQKIFSLS
ncbi:E3 ubiquitin-protein ligase, putative [Plasmodium knowlesi strain H]|uniref:HECT-type E3 ubiquitin transferase n=1 Tax=Plasmodium knowlesi (strain H) TaxID=5851 RepID=A0A193RG66_PLAKH|nr:E3 ubiquitin-protein ligase, putative [Plasmodium knowlesi strain H]SBO27611.1 E3 ubiquitin-protein ligase, putative [Plasmodium knowlesi strain H]